MSDKTMEPQHQSEEIRKSTEKQSFEQVDYAKPENVQRDYSGAAAKTDPAEIALVRKLDWNILVCFVRTCGL